MTNLFQKFLLLMWKNCIMMLRNPCHIIIQFIWPLLFLLLIFMYRQINSVVFQEKLEFEPKKIKLMLNEKICDAYNPVVAISPKNYFLTSALRNVCPDVDPEYAVVVREFGSKAEMDKKFESDEDFKREILFGIQFNDSIKYLDQIQNLDLEVILRLKKSFDTKDEYYYSESLFYSIRPEEEDKFLVAQWLATSLLMDNKDSIVFELQKFSFPEYYSDTLRFEKLAVRITPLIMIAFLVNYIFIIKTIAFEKENQLKESMKVMGLPGWLQWLTWFLHSLIINVIIVIILLVGLMLLSPPIFSYSGVLILFVLFILFACANITQAFFITTVFSTANVATFAGFILYLIGMALYFILLEKSEKGRSANTVFLSSLFPLSGLGYGLGLIYKFEEIHLGIQSQTIWKKLYSENVCFGHILLMFLLDSFLYMILTLYIERVFPGEYGIPQPWYFPCYPLFWLRRARAKVRPEDNVNTRKEALVEPMSENRAVGIQLINLTKSFNGQEVVKNLSLDIYEGHLTVLLGHNGAGKTTILNMINGMFPPSKGTAIVAKHDVTKKGADVRNSIGLCLQHNVYFEKLTVRDHLLFFSKLKGMNEKEIQPQINEYLKTLDLEEKKKSFPATLSGGMKRKLGVAIALCGQSKVVILDEPTAGLDPSARRQVWTLLQKEKEKRTILLTTHFMDEADILGDRVAIIAGGELTCCGSSFFLKQKYGIGYHLTLDVSPRCQPYRITNLLRNHIKLLKMQSHLGSEIRYNLGNDSSRFEIMLHDLEVNAQNLEIRSFGISAASLEDVFMKFETENEKTSKESNKSSKLSFDEEVVERGADRATRQNESLKGVLFIANQAQALFWKRALFVARTWPWIVIKILIPFVFLLLAVKFAEKERSRRYRGVEEPPLKLSLDIYSYDKPVPLLSGLKDGVYYQKYLEILTNSGYDVLETPDITEKIMELMTFTPFDAKFRYFLGATFKKSPEKEEEEEEEENVKHYITAWYHGAPYHSSAVSLSLVLKSWYAVENNNRTLTFIDHPYPQPQSEPEEPIDRKKSSPIHREIALHLGIGMALTYGLYILFYIQERASGHKHLQFASGVNVIVFWTTALLCDLIVHLLVTISVLITFAIIQEHPFITAEVSGCVFFIFVSFFVFGFPSLYLASHMFNTPVMGFIFVTLTSLCAVAVMFTMIALPNTYVEEVFSILIWTPFFCFVNGIFNIATLETLRKFCDPAYCRRYSKCCYSSESYYEFNINGIGINMVVAIFMFFVLFSVLILIGTGAIRRCSNCCFSKKKPPLPANIDSDVKEEAEKITNTSVTTLTRSNILLIRDLTKYYKKFTAVNGLSLAVKSGECFGLLGENGAGKTTTFKMITGDVSISYGDAWINGFNIKKDLTKVHQSIGYCPQFDALLDNLTPRETFRIIALIRGIPYKNCAAVIDKLSDEFELSQILDKRVKHLSGGNKRKLSIALALIGDPPIIYLDEPSTGLDPAAKRRLWSSLAKLRDSGKCIILTSQSMEECEALCTRLAVMVKGNFQCLGSSQSLKNKFVQAYSLIIKVKKPVDENKVAAIDNFVMKNFPGAKLSERFEEMLNYELVRGKTLWSQIFGIIEKNKKVLGIEEYSLGQCSLEQVFLSLVQH